MLRRAAALTFALGAWTLYAGLEAETAAFPQTVLRVQTFAREQAIVSNPIRWPQFTFLVPEGSRVQAGDLLFELDPTPPLQRRQDLQNRIAEHENSTLIRLGAIEDRMISLRDQEAQLQDQHGVQNARLRHLRSLPQPEETAIARGRLEVAGRNLEAARTERDTMRLRLESGLVAPASLEQAETQLRILEARMRFARSRLATVSRPAEPASIRIVELRIANLELEMEKIAQETASQEELYRIESRSTDRQLAELVRELDEVEEELRNTQVFSPREGVVIYTSRLKRELASGSKPARGMALAEIPDPGSLAIRGQIPEDLRSVFQPGDPAEIVLNPLPDRVFPGRLHSISSVPRDLSDLERRGGEDSLDTGVKVYDVVITLDEIPGEIPFGVYGSATLRSSLPVVGPSVPLDWVRIREGSPHLSLDGIFRKVEGLAVGTRFVITEDGLGGARPGPEGIWPQSGDEGAAVNSDRVTATGLLRPLERVMIVVPPIRSWDIRVARLVPEDTRVQPGDLLAELDSEQISSQLNQAQIDLTRVQGERETAEQQLQSRRREAEFQLERARNLLAIRTLELELAERAVPETQIQQALLEEETARIQVTTARSELERFQRNPELGSEAELRRRERELRRRELLLEQAVLQLGLAEAGTDAAELSRIRLEKIREAANLAQLEATWSRNLIQSEAHLRWRERRERGQQQRLDNVLKEKADLRLRAPGPGIVKYENLWDGFTLSKLRLGMSVWGRMELMSLSDASRMTLQVTVPERYVPELRTGMPVQVRIPSEGSRNWRGEVIRLDELLEPAEPGALRTGLFANQEPPLEHVISVEVLVLTSETDELKPGAVAHVIFPFAR